MEPTDQPEKNRRTSRRRSAKRSAQVVCFANGLGLGPNVAVSLLDVSESGARIKVKTLLAPRQEVELDLCGIGHRRSVKLISNVVWCEPATDGTFLVGVKFQRYLTYHDLQELGN